MVGQMRKRSAQVSVAFQNADDFLIPMDQVEHGPSIGHPRV